MVHRSTDRAVLTATHLHRTWRRRTSAQLLAYDPLPLSSTRPALINSFLRDGAVGAQTCACKNAAS